MDINNPAHLAVVSLIFLSWTIICFYGGKFYEQNREEFWPSCFIAVTIIGAFISALVVIVMFISLIVNNF